MTKIHEIHNMAKLRILAAVKDCQDKGIPATSSKIAELTGKKKSNICDALNHLSEDWPYLKKTWARRPKRYPTAKTRQEKNDRRKGKKPQALTTRDFYVYKLAAQGERVLPKLLERYSNGLELNPRRKKPRQVIDGKIVSVQPVISAGPSGTDGKGDPNLCPSGPGDLGSQGGQNLFSPGPTSRKICESGQN